MAFNLYVIALLLALITSVTPSIKQLREHLAVNYSMLDRPVILESKTVNVDFGFTLTQLLSVSESTHTLKVKGELTMVWQDDYLQWDRTKWNGIGDLRMKPTDIWIPDIILLEDVRDDAVSGNSKYKTNIRSTNDGYQEWFISNAIFELSCRFDIQNFPFDVHRCNMTFRSSNYYEKQLNMSKWSGYLSEVQLADADWNVTSASVVRYNPCAIGCAPQIVYKFILRRKATQFLTNILVPSIIQMIIIIFTFILPPESGERIGVSVTVLLVFAVYLEVIREQVPSGSTTTAVSKFYLTAMAGSALSTIATCFVLVIYFNGSKPGVGPVPKIIKQVFLEWKLTRCFCIRNNAITENHTNAIVLKNREIKNEVEKEEDIPSSENEIANEIRVITSHLKEKDAQDAIEEEWHLLANVVDRIFFFTFLFFFTISSLIILLPISR